jgi:hypothetical protein
MLKDVAALQAQHLQKINEITALRAKLLELNSIESIISGGVATTDKAALSRGGAGGGAGGAGGAGGGGYLACVVKDAKTFCTNHPESISLKIRRK